MNNAQYSASGLYFFIFYFLKIVVEAAIKIKGVTLISCYLHKEV
jgi:hypothetical protein